MSVLLNRDSQEVYAIKTADYWIKKSVLLIQIRINPNYPNKKSVLLT